MSRLVDTEHSSRWLVGPSPTRQPIVGKELRVFVEELGVVETVILGLHTDRLHSLELASVV